MIEQLPKLMVQKHDYRIYRVDLIFENNYNPIKPKVTKSIAMYILELLKLRVWSAGTFVNTEIQILQATVHENEGVVRIHWKFRGLPQLQVLKMWKFVPGRYSKSIKEKSVYYEGIS